MWGRRRRNERRRNERRRKGWREGVSRMWKHTAFGVPSPDKSSKNRAEERDKQREEGTKREEEWVGRDIGEMADVGEHVGVFWRIRT